MDLKAYAAAAGKPYDLMAQKAQAWRVFSVGNISNDPPTDWVSYSVIRAAPQWLWPALVEKMVAEGWTVAAKDR